MIEFDEYDTNLARISDQLIVFHSRLQIKKWAEYCWKYFNNYDLHFWYKSNAIPFTHNTWKSDVEYIALGWREKHHIKVPQEQKSKVFIHPIETQNLHPAQKPVSLIEKYILILNAQTILDPYLGGGTTVYCANKLNRKSIGIEISEKYCQIAVDRLRQGVFKL
jgi:DNA modification methylase